MSHTTSSPTALPEKAPTLRLIPMPSDINHRGTVFGGWLLAQIDLACSIEAANCSRGLVTTVAINSLTFESPIHVRDLVNIYASIVRIGNTSMTLNVEVYTERHPEAPEIHRVASGEWVFVAVDEDHRPRPILREPDAPHA